MNEVVANYDGNLKDAVQLVKAPINDVKVGIDGSCKEGEHDVTQ
jgi:hypothetical protein